MSPTDLHVIVTGTLGYDYIMDFPGRFIDRIMPEALHKISLSFLVERLSKQFGGTAGNIAYSLKLLGVTPHIVSSAGNDFGPYKEFLEKNGIDTGSIALYADEPTGSYHVVTDRDDNQIGAFHVGATKYAKTLRLTKGDFAVIAPTDPSAMISYISQCRRARIPYLYDPAFQIDHFTAKELREGIENARILIGNDYEMTLIEQKLEITHIDLLVMVPVVVTTLGAKGSIVETARESIHIGAAKAASLKDPTGSGDAYRAGFLSGYLRHFPLDVCGQMGSVAAVYTVEKYGTVTHLYTAVDFCARFKANYGKTLDLSTH